MHLFGEMLPAGRLATAPKLKMRAARLSMGLFLLYFGTRRQYPDVAHHTIWLGERFRELLDDIFKRKTLAKDFSLYIHRPTATDPSFAPPAAIVSMRSARCPISAPAWTGPRKRRAFGIRSSTRWTALCFPAFERDHRRAVSHSG